LMMTFPVGLVLLCSGGSLIGETSVLVVSGLAIHLPG
jgi:hypothetical protein